MYNLSEETKQKLLKHFGTQRDMAKWLGREPATCSYYFNGKVAIPVPLALKIAKKTGISFFDLRPDIPRE